MVDGNPPGIPYQVYQDKGLETIKGLNSWMDSVLCQLAMEPVDLDVRVETEVIRMLNGEKSVIFRPAHNFPKRTHHNNSLTPINLRNPFRKY